MNGDGGGMMIYQENAQTRDRDMACSSLGDEVRRKGLHWLTLLGWLARWLAAVGWPVFGRVGEEI
jgi:hypothetical protein